MDLSAPVLVGVFIGILTLIGSRRKAGDAFQDKPQDMARFFTSASKEKVFRVVRQYARRSGMEIEDLDEAQGRMVLGQNARGFHNGFWLPVYVRERPDGLTLVEIGVRSKTLQGAFALNRIRDKAVGELRSRLRAA